MRAWIGIAFAAIAFLTVSCQRQDASDHISINGKVFIFNVRLARAFYMLTLNRLEAVPDGSVVVAEFENPAGGAPLVKEQKVFPKMARIDLQSPDVECVVADRPYAIHIILKDPEGKVLQTIDTTLASTLDQSILPAAALVEGPAYDRNPAAFNADGTTKFRSTCADKAKPKP
jgi:hypothetical protein